MVIGLLYLIFILDILYAIMNKYNKLGVINQTKWIGSMIFAAKEKGYKFMKNELLIFFLRYWVGVQEVYPHLQILART